MRRCTHGGCAHGSRYTRGAGVVPRLARVIPGALLWLAVLALRNAGGSCSRVAAQILPVPQGVVSRTRSTERVVDHLAVAGYPQHGAAIRTALQGLDLQGVHQRIEFHALGRNTSAMPTVALQGLGFRRSDLGHARSRRAGLTQR